jgi:hypothetical protein
MSASNGWGMQKATRSLLSGEEGSVSIRVPSTTMDEYQFKRKGESDGYQ